MKKLILSAVVFSMAVAVQAQEIPERKTERPGMLERKRHHVRHHRMDLQKLNLSEDQKAKFKSQNESFRKQVDDLKKNENITVKDFKTKMESIRKEHKSKVEGILTADQKAQLEKMKTDGIAKQKEMAKQRAERMKTNLGLTDEQSSRMESSRKEMGEKMKAIRENKSLSDEQKKEQLKELHKKQKENMKSILTKEQLEKLKESRHKRPEGERRKPEVKETI